MKFFVDSYQTKRGTSSPSMQWQNSGTGCSGYQRFAGVQKADWTSSWKKNASRAIRPSETIHPSEEILQLAYFWNLEE